MRATALSYEGLDGGHAPADIALMAGEASSLLDAWASSPSGFYACLSGFFQRAGDGGCQQGRERAEAGGA